MKHEAKGSMVTGFVIILGSPNNDNGELTEMGMGRLALGREQFLVWKPSGWKILLTGGFGEHFNRTAVPHAEYAKRLLLAQGLEELDFTEMALSCNTVDDALKSREIVDKYGSPELLVVSSDFHLRRVEFIFRHVFPDKQLTFAGAAYIATRSESERQRLLAHEYREFENLRLHGESIVGGRLSINSWRPPAR